MEALGISASVLGAASFTKSVIANLPRDLSNRDVPDRLWVIQNTISQGAAILPELNADEVRQDTTALCLSNYQENLSRLNAVIEKGKKGGVRSLLLSGEVDRLIKELEGWAELFIREISQWQTLRMHEIMIENLHISSKNNAMMSELLAICHQNNDTFSSGMDLIIQKGICNDSATVEPGPSNPSNLTSNSRFNAITPKFVGHFTASTDTAKMASTVSKNLEEASRRLRELSMMGTDRSFTFPFIIVPDDPQEPSPTPLRVKLDSGCELNWISSRILERTQLANKSTKIESPKAWLGFNGDGGLIVAQRAITLTWYSVNAAYTHRHEFLVHDDVPFDVVLGSEFIIEESWKKSFNDPVLALRYSDLSDEQLDEIHSKARQNKEETEAQKKIERAIRAKDRQMRRMLNASRAGTPKFSQTPAFSQTISRRDSMATIPFASSPLAPALGVQESQPIDAERVGSLES
ncbi:hypothetical protein FSARC_13977 [Fusarium sarcochroum]|uniref:Uncharacterized protein n=1 Tax=Fusarium sarcochroum TaxID=1208366 RepID=A0A8H4WRH7_9HYPO|nr:hypothetical protein FSARC_13977 [Fusarium sarcochroum]